MGETRRSMLVAALFGPALLSSCGGIAEMDVPVYQREAAMIALARGDVRQASDLLYASLEKLDQPGTLKDSALGWSVAAVTDARALSYRPDDYELILMLSLRAIASLGDTARNLGDLHQAEVRQDDVFASYSSSDYDGVPAENRVTRDNYQLIALPYYLEAALEEQDPLGGRERAVVGYRKVLELQTAQRSSCPLAGDMAARLGEGKVFTEGGAVHVVGFLGRGPQKYEETSVIAPALISAVSVIVSVWGFGEVMGSDISVVPLPYPELALRDRVVASLGVTAAGGRKAVSSCVTDVSAVAKSQFESRKPWIIAQALIPRLLKTVALKVGETAAIKAQNDASAQAFTKLGFFITKLLWEYSERADTRCWMLLPDMVHAARLDLPEGRQTIRIQALDRTQNPHGGREVEVNVAKGRNTFVFVIAPSLDGEPAIFTAN